MILNEGLLLVLVYIGTVIFHSFLNGQSSLFSNIFLLLYVYVMGFGKTLLNSVLLKNEIDN